MTKDLCAKYYQKNSTKTKKQTKKRLKKTPVTDIKIFLKKKKLNIKES